MNAFRLSTPNLRRRSLVPLLAAAAAAPASRARAQSTTVLRLGTTPEGGGFAPYSLALIETLQSIDPGLELRNVPTEGSTDNADLMQSGAIDIGLVGGEVLYDRAAKMSPRAPKLRVVSVMYSTPGLFAVRADSPYREIGDLKGRPVVWGPRSAGRVAQARYVMEGLRLDMDHDFTAIYPDDFSEGPTLVLAGRAAALWGSGLRLPDFVQIADHPLGARLVAPNARQIVQIRTRHPFLVQLTVPAGTYPAQHQDVTSVGSWSYIMARPDLDEAAGHRLAAALYKAEQMALKSRYLTQTTVRNTLIAVGAQEDLQPGVMRFYREAKFVE
jgi:uncharacterized protein